MTKICLLPIFLLLTVVALANITIEINAGDFDRKETLISFPVPRELSSVDHFSLRNMDNRAKVGIQRKDSLLFFVLDQPLAAGQSRQYQLSSRKRSADYSAKALYRLPEVILSIDDQTVLHYHIQEKLAPGQPEYYKRSGFIHPLKTPGGKILTDDFPLGHAHQHALFFACRNTTYKGENVDFWNQQDKTGTVGHQKLIDHFSGEVLTGFQSRLEHLSLKQGVVLEETWAVSATKAGPYFIVDLQSIQENTSKDTLFIHQYLYGGLGLRGSKHWNRDDSLNYTGEMNILTSESKTRVEANHTKPQWIKMGSRPVCWLWDIQAIFVRHKASGCTLKCPIFVLPP